MTKRTRLLILSLCVVLFFIIAPYIIVYSFGYRVDFEQKKLVATGGIFIKALPQGVNVIIDSKISNRTSLLSPSVFVQNLLPKQHSILIKKDGYHDYNKTLEVKEKEATRLERVILFKEKIPFEVLTGETNSPFLKEEPKKLFVIKNQESTMILKKLLSSEVSGNNIIWLGLDGLLYSSSQDGKTTNELGQKPLKINRDNSYELIIISQNIFLKENNNLLLFNQKTKTFETFYSLVKDFKISPDRTKILYYNDNEILYSYLNFDNPEKIFLNRFSEKIGEVFWLNDNYLIFSLGEKIIISEIDNRDSVNMITLQQTLSSTDKIFLNQQDKKLYILTKDTLLSSERLIP